MHHDLSNHWIHTTHSFVETLLTGGSIRLF